MNVAALPIVLCCIDAVEAIVCVCNGDWARTLYWASAACITLSTIFMK